MLAGIEYEETLVGRLPAGPAGDAALAAAAVRPRERRTAEVLDLGAASRAAVAKRAVPVVVAAALAAAGRRRAGAPPPPSARAARPGAPMTEVLRFDDERCLEVAAAGGKGASLARMAGLGLPVPPGFAVHASALVAALPDDGARAARRCSRATTTRAPPSAPRRSSPGSSCRTELAEAITGAYAALGDEAEVAVRSSACAEDSEAASFAGQQETYLHVRGAEEVLRRVRDCWGSFFSERALFYRAKKGSLEDLDMAVVVQRMVAADVAGVLFTIDPTRGRKDRMVVEAVFGLGEAVVSGQVTPGPLRARPRRARETRQPHDTAAQGRPPRGRRRPRGAARRGGRRRAHADRRAARGAGRRSAATCRSGWASRRTSSGRSRAASCSCSRRAR